MFLQLEGVLFFRVPIVKALAIVYILLSHRYNKMRQIESGSIVAVAGEWFMAHGEGINLGYFGKPENAPIAEKLRKVFAEWIDNGHNDFSDEKTVILQIELTDAVLLSHGTRYER